VDVVFTVTNPCTYDKEFWGPQASFFWSGLYDITYINSQFTQRLGQLGVGWLRSGELRAAWLCAARQCTITGSSTVGGQITLPISKVIRVS